LSELPRNKCGGETKGGAERGRQKWVLEGGEVEAHASQRREGGGKKRMGGREAAGSAAHEGRRNAMNPI